MRPFDIIGHTSDIGITSYGRSLPELFVNASKGMFNIITTPAIKISNIKHHKEKDMTIKNPSDEIEGLLVEFLSELLYLSSKDKILFIDFDILEFDCNILRGVSKYIDIRRYDIEFIKEIKAVTFHGLKIIKKDNIYSTDIYFDV